MQKFVGYYDYTVVLTYSGMVSALIGVFYAFHGDFTMALICLMLSGVCDAFDGAVANTKKRTESEKNFGIQIDSLCDLISFGVLPGMIVYCLNGESAVSAFICIVYTLCALIRLAYFNVLEAERQKQTTEKRKDYLGLPVTTIAFILPFAYLLYMAGVFKAKVLFLPVMLIVAIMFIAPINVAKPYGKKKAVLAVIGFTELCLTLFLRTRL